ncbi:hypothetical protein ACJX0J_023417 [Zea mays]
MGLCTMLFVGHNPFQTNFKSLIGFGATNLRFISLCDEGSTGHMVQAFFSTVLMNISSELLLLGNVWFGNLSKPAEYRKKDPSGQACLIIQFIVQNTVLDDHMDESMFFPTGDKLRLLDKTSL